MFQPDQTSQAKPVLSMKSITIELHGAALVSTKEDADRISEMTGQPVLGFTWEQDGRTETWVGRTRLNVVGNHTTLTLGLYKDPVIAGYHISDWCHLMAMILDGAEDTVDMLVIRLKAMATVRHELGRSIHGTELESNVLAPAGVSDAERFPVWHRLTANRDGTAHGLFDFHVNYEATAAIVAERHPTGDLMADVALTLMDEMLRRTTQAVSDRHRYEDEDDEPDQLAPLSDPVFFDGMIVLFGAPNYDYRCKTLRTVARGLTSGYLTVPDGTLGSTIAALKRLDQGYQQLADQFTFDSLETEDLDRRSIALFEQIRQHTWPSDYDAADGP